MLFSIVIPSRNRPHLVRYALRSVLDQSFDDFEIIVSENNPTEEIKGIVEKIGDKRIRYFCTKRVMSMPDSWEFGLNHSRGDYVTILGDDDAFLPHTLERIEKIISGRDPQLVSWVFASYYHESWWNEKERNTGHIPLVSGRIYEKEGRRTLKELYELKETVKIPRYQLPFFLNAFCRRDLIEKIKNKFGKLFGEYAPDQSALPKCLSCAPTYLFIDQCLSIGGVAKESIGLSGAHLPSMDIVGRSSIESRDKKLFKHTPLSFPAGANFDAETLLRVREINPGLFPGIELDWKMYFVKCLNNVLVWESHGADVSREKRELETAIRSFPAGCQFALKKFKLKQWLRTGLGHTPLLYPYSWIQKRLKPQWNCVHRFEGKSLRFTNIVEFGRYLSQLKN